jgi:spore coat polysaccharide biosynthesis protein SpsF
VDTGIFVQVRLGSTRLPRKAVLPLGGATVIQHVMRAMAAVPAQVRALLTDAQSAGVLLPLAEAEGWEVFPGHPEDVLRRYCDACRHYRVGLVVRVTGDNPLTSGALAREIMAAHERQRADLSHYLGIPWGMGVEVVEAAALYQAEAEAVLPDEREHITTFLYRNPARFVLYEPPAPPSASCPDARVTIDTPEDFQTVSALFADLYRGSPLEAAQVIAWVRASLRKTANG